MSILDTRPQGVAIHGYAGDTLTLTIVTDVDYSTYTWSGEVRTDHADGVADATFSFGVQTPVSTKFHTPATLTAADTRGLADLIPEDDLPPVYTKSGTSDVSVSTQQYNGLWDIQVTAPGGEVTTLVQGTITIDADVTI